MSRFAATKGPLPVAAAGDARSPLFCPKPRRPVRCHQSGGGAGMDLLDLLLLSKGEEGGLSAASPPPPPPPFCGSPPRRASNPVVRDSRFGMTDCPAPRPVPARAYPAPRPSAAAAPTPSMSPRGCARARFAFQPAAVRVEGFDCLDGGHGRGITAMA